RAGIGDAHAGRVDARGDQPADQAAGHVAAADESDGREGLGRGSGGGHGAAVGGKDRNPTASAAVPANPNGSGGIVRRVATASWPRSGFEELSFRAQREIYVFEKAR